MGAHTFKTKSGKNIPTRIVLAESGSDSFFDGYHSVGHMGLEIWPHIHTSEKTVEISGISQCRFYI